MFSVSPAATVVVSAVPFEHVAVGSARAGASGATHFESGILTTSPMLRERGLVICALTNCIWESVMFAEAAMLASESPALTVWFATILQFVPVWARAGMMQLASAVMKSSEDRIVIRYVANTD